MKMFGIGRKDNGTELEPAKRNEHEARRRAARIAGLMYVGVIIFGIGAQAIRMSLYDPDDAVATVENISANMTAFRLSFLSDIAMTMFYAMLGVTAYQLFRSYDDRASLVMLVLVVVSAAIGGLSLVHQFAVVQLLDGPGYVAALGQDYLTARVMEHMDMLTSGIFVAQIIGWGPWLFPLGYMGYRSGYFPKAIGVLLMLAPAGYLVEGIQHFALPGMEWISAPGLVLAAVTEFATVGWLLAKGVSVRPFAELAEPRAVPRVADLG